MAVSGGGAPAGAGEKRKRLILCFDGTWNAHEDQTNVARLYDAVADARCGCPHQQKFYDEGVGTDPWTRFRGGITGHGMEGNVQQGYSWLIRALAMPGWSPAARKMEADGEEFDIGPDIFLFGFSRGAYTARSLGGLINRCGVPRLDALGIKDKEGKLDPTPTIEQIREASLVKEAWELYRKDLGPQEARRLPEPKKFRHDHCRTVKIKFIGVWDTVGARGLPLIRSKFVPHARANYAFHDTGLGRVVENAYHAIAIDEHREDYDVTLWTKVHPGGNQQVEQRWFPGAHSNVGGGYEDDMLADRPLEWMTDMALGHGLEFIRDPRETALEKENCVAAKPENFKLTGEEYRWPVRDSYGEFMHGAYAALKRLTKGKLVQSGRHFRPMLVHGVNEVVDPTATLKVAGDTNYRPRNLALAGLAP